jgi:hypothetical protein
LWVGAQTSLFVTVDRRKTLHDIQQFRVSDG